MITLAAPDAVEAGSSICISVTGASGDIAISIEGAGTLSSVEFVNGKHKVTIKTSRSDWGSSIITIGANGERHLVGVGVG